jgi:hypothetical protein
MKVVEGRSGVTIIFAQIRGQETAQRSTMCLIPKVIIKMTTLKSVGEKNAAKEAQICLKNPFFEQNSLDKDIKWCSSAHCHV